MSKIKLTTNTSQFPNLFAGFVNFSLALPKIQLPKLSVKDSSSAIIGIIVISYAVLMLIGIYGLNVYQNNTQSLYQNRLLGIKSLNDASELIQKTDLAMKSAIYDAAKDKIKSTTAIDGFVASNISKLSEVLNTYGSSSKSIQEKEVLESYTGAYSEWISKDLKSAQSAIIGNNIALASQIYNNSGDMIAILDQNAKALIKIQYEDSKKDVNNGRGYLYFFMVFGALISLFAIFLTIYLLSNSKRMLASYLGTEPEKLLEAAGHVASGNFKFPVNTRDGDHSSVLAAIKAIQEECRLFLLDTEILNKSMSQGKNLGRRDIEQHQGEFQNLAKELNLSIDYSLSHSQESEQKYKEIARYFTSTNEEILELLKTIQNNDLSVRLSSGLDIENESPPVTTINHILGLMEDILTKVREHANTVKNADEKIKLFQEKLHSISSDQRSIINESKNSLDKVASLNKASSRSLKSIQNRAIEASKSIHEIYQKINALNNGKLDATNKINKVITVVSPLDNISFTSLDSSKIAITNNESKKFQNIADIEQINQMTDDIKRLIETLNNIAKDGSKIMLNNAEQSSNLSERYADLVKIENSIQKIEQFTDVSIADEARDLNALASSFMLKADAEKLEKEKQHTEAMLTEKKVNEKTRNDSDWELF